LPPELLFLAQICTKSFVGWGFSPDPTGGAYSAPPDPLAVFRGPTLREEGQGRREGRGGEGRELRREKGGEGRRRELRTLSFALGRKKKSRRLCNCTQSCCRVHS